MTQSCDVAIVGGGVMGCAVAYFLMADPAFHGSVLVIERDPSYANCATTRSWGGIRQQFSTAGNVEMSLFGVDFVRKAAETLAVEGEGPDLAFKEHGYLFLASASGLPVLDANCALQRRLGAKVARLDPSGLAARFPWLNVDGLAGGALGLANEGWIDPNALLHGFRRKARALGARFVTDEVVKIAADARRIEGLSLRDGGRLACGHLVNAAGPQAGAVAALAGVPLPVSPRKRSSFVFDCRTEIPDMPLTIDTNGVACRPEGGQYIAIVSPPADRDPDCDDLEPDYGWFDEVIWPSLAHRIPAFEAIKLISAWGGHYDYNAVDQNAIIGPHPSLRGLWFCNGFSGHGIQQAPAAGRALAERIVHGRFLTIDLSAFGYERLESGRLLVEANVV
ncbi:MAG: FAD-binding oxidoreductase [Kiloniellales bacterium]|nr:FAD-binding oxidoreductase [Kiloniellales bacterium]